MSSFNLHPKRSAIKKRRRVGRGVGSTLGKTCGRGHKGQKSRSGASISPWFEGGQTPLYRRVPKRGFTNRSSQEWSILNFDDLMIDFEKFSSLKTVDVKVLRENGIIAKKKRPLKLLGRNFKKKTDISKKDLQGKTFILNACSSSGRSFVEKAGGIIKVVDLNPVIREKNSNGKLLKRKKDETR